MDGLGERALGQEGRIGGRAGERQMHRHEPGGRLGAARQRAGLRGRLAQFRLDAIEGAEISQEGRRPVVAGFEGLDTEREHPAAMQLGG